MEQTNPQFKLRIPPDIKRWVAAQAERNLRSQGAEIIMALREKMEAEHAENKPERTNCG